jgi:hypothetical protein
VGAESAGDGVWGGNSGEMSGMVRRCFTSVCRLDAACSSARSASQLPSRKAYSCWMDGRVEAYRVQILPHASVED